MPENIDAKRYIDKKERYSHTLRERFDKREIPSFQELFSHSQSAPLNHEQKKGKDIIQFSFFITTREGDIMLIERSDKSHVITRGLSLLVSWSPAVSVFPSGNSWPSDQEDLFFIFHKEITSELLKKPELKYTGFARNDMDSERTYYFHIFEAHYPCSSFEFKKMVSSMGRKNLFIKDKDIFVDILSLENLKNKYVITNDVDSALLDFIHRKRLKEVYMSGENCILLPGSFLKN